MYEDKDQNGDKEYKMRLLNCINLVDISAKRKKPMQTPDQIDYLKELILDYNQGGDDTYSNILGIYIDAGSGGGGVNIADYLMPDWKGKDGKIHRGLIDKEYSEEYIKKFPNAVNKIHLMSPTQYKSEMYEAMIELMNQDKINFTASYDGKGYITMFDIDKEKYDKTKADLIAKYKKQKLSQEEIEENVQKDLDNLQNVKSRVEKLNWQEQIALASIDALKEELVNMIRIKRESGKDSFEICPEKRNKLHDDRAYVMCMACDICDMYSNLLFDEDLDLWNKVKSWENVKFIKEKEDSLACVKSHNPKIILSSSGFCTNGRILSYLHEYLNDENSMVIFSGYTGSDNSYLSYRIKNYKENKFIKISGDKVENKADCISLGTFSSHANRNELLTYGSKINTEKLVLVHGSIVAKNSLKEDLKESISKENKTFKVIASTKDMVIGL